MSNLDDLACASPHYYGDNFPNGELSDFNYNRTVLDIGGSVIHEKWRLPDWVDQPPAGSSPATDRIADPETYVAAKFRPTARTQSRHGRS
jgi:hypothetical protein